MAIVTTLDHECADMASAVFDLTDSNSWLRAEACDGMWVVTLRDEDATRAEVAFEADELAHVLQTLGTLVEPAEPEVLIDREIRGQGRILEHRCDPGRHSFLRRPESHRLTIHPDRT